MHTDFQLALDTLLTTDISNYTFKEKRAFYEAVLRFQHITAFDRGAKVQKLVYTKENKWLNMNVKELQII